MLSEFDVNLSKSEFPLANKALEEQKNKSMVKQVLTSRVIFTMQNMLQMFPNVRTLQITGFD